ncbi:hypothetical protein BYT27DRAFT_7344147 [Phlegmacium glaucopus]|nr:hypothetical protein BYT27DRAFT_7344147 [Phlegmacium glaucopus]
MFNLPTELTLYILSYLPFDSLSRLKAVCKSWNEFSNLQESTIYRNAACLHAYIPCPRTMLKDLGSLYSQRALEGVKTWKDLGRKRLQIQRNWKGQGPSIVVEHKSTSLEWTHMVHRIKVDELAGYIMTTSHQGGILVTDLNEDRALWALPPWYVRPYAHLEYGEGYMIFDRNNGDKEVWRRLSDISEHVVVESSAPDAIQREMYNEMYKSRPPVMHGHFQPWAVLHMSEPTSAYRCVYPTLIVAGYARVFLWDVPSGKLIQTIQGIQYLGSENGHLGRIKYVEISERHVFLISQFHLRVFSRATGKSVLDISSSKQRYGFWKYERKSMHCPTPGSTLMRFGMAATQEPYVHENPSSDEIFVSVHVSACGRHFVALLSGCRLLVVYDFEKMTSEKELYAQTLDIQITSRMYDSIYLAFDYGRISVATTNGIFIIHVDESTLGNISNEAPTLTVCRLCQLRNEATLDAISCLMISDTGLYLNWNPTAMEDEKFVPWSEDDFQEIPPSEFQESLSSVFSVNFARC